LQKIEGRIGAGRAGIQLGDLLFRIGTPGELKEVRIGERDATETIAGKCLGGPLSQLQTE